VWSAKAERRNWTPFSGKGRRADTSVSRGKRPVGGEDAEKDARARLRPAHTTLNPKDDDEKKRAVRAAGNESRARRDEHARYVTDDG